MVPGLIYLDNYDEGAGQRGRGYAVPLLVALIDRKITKYIFQYDGIARNLRQTNILFIIKKQISKELQANRFFTSGRSESGQYR